MNLARFLGLLALTCSCVSVPIDNAMPVASKFDMNLVHLASEKKEVSGPLAGASVQKLPEKFFEMEPEKQKQVMSTILEPEKQQKTIQPEQLPTPASAVAQTGKILPVATETTNMLDIVVIIPTVRRFQNDGSPAPDRYLQPMVNKLWSDMTESQRKHVKIFILNSDKEPEKHVEAEGLKQHPGVTLFHKTSIHDDVVQSVSTATALEDGREVSTEWLSWVASENADGAFLMQKAKSLAPYILFLEDDVWPTTKALEKLTKFVREFKKTDWLFLDLYTPNLDWAPGMLTFESGDKYNFTCCTQAMLFRSDRVDGVIKYWLQHPGEPIDDNLRNYNKKETPELAIYGVRPNLFEHLGAYSSNPQKSTGIVEHTSLEFLPLLIQGGTEVH